MFSHLSKTYEEGFTVMSWFILVIMIIFNIYFLLYFRKANKEIRDELSKTKIKYSSLLKELEEQNKKIDELLEKLLEETTGNPGE